MHLLRLIIISALLFKGSDKDPDTRNIFIPPVKIPLSLSANFGELRPDHFHSGLDIRTEGVTGKEVVATASGYVYRITVSPGGFGKALYIRHPSGYSTVYGHLDKFTPEIEDYVIARQYEEKSYMITLWPQKDKFSFRQGDVIAYSGNSGSSSGPHLHYEVRKSEEEVPINPLLFDFGIEDKIKPVIEQLVVYPVRRNSLVNNQHSELRLNVAGNNGNYFIPADRVITINGHAGFGIKTYDLLDKSYNRYSVYSIELKVDSLSVFNYRMDAFPFNESRYINSHIDYATYVREDIFIERAFVLPNDRLCAYHNLVNNGIFNFRDSMKHHVVIIVTDIYDNKSSLSFFVRSAKPESNGTQTTVGIENVLMPHGRNNKFVTKDVSVNIPSGTLYDTLYFEFKKSPGNQAMYSDVFQIHNRYTPVHRPYSLSVRLSRIPAGKESKLMIVQTLDDNRRNPVGSSYENGILTCNPNSFGTFYAGIDTIPPGISINGLKAGANLTGRSELKIRIYDNFSGIKEYVPLIDNKWALFEYDLKNNMLIYRFDPERIKKGTKHFLSLDVTDNRDNKSTMKWEFVW